MTKKKSYNPFKMFGSYIGALMGAGNTLYNFYFTGIGHSTVCSQLNPTEFIATECIAYSSRMFPFIPIIVLVIIGFLIGWGIHSLIRKLRE